MASQGKTKKKRANDTPIQKNEPISEINANYEGVFRVEKGIPMPIRSERESLVSKFPLKMMEISDSFLIPKPYSRTLQNSIKCQIRQYCKRNKIKGEFGVFKDEISGFLRCWRKA